MPSELVPITPQRSRDAPTLTHMACLICPPPSIVDDHDADRRLRSYIHAHTNADIAFPAAPVNPRSRTSRM